MTPLAPLIAELDALLDRFASVPTLNYDYEHKQVGNALIDAYPALRAAALAAEGMRLALEHYVGAVAVGGGSDKQSIMAAIRAADDHARKVLGWTAPLSQDKEEK